MIYDEAVPGRRITIIELIERLRERGWRLSAQRRAVAEVLTGDHVHLTADEVHARAQVVLPEISLATVYNTLNELAAMGEVVPVSAGAGPRRYDPNSNPHHHLVCVECGAIRDVDPAGLSELELSKAEQHGYRLLDVNIVFRGVCSDCERAA